ncbi:MAG: D-alanyl-D-alanine carboxypeptidase family protein [Pseudomonadota bacterium]
MFSYLIRIFSAIILTGLVTTQMSQTAHAQAFETAAKQALLYDVQTGSTLFSKDADKQIPPASLAKLMTMEVVFNALKIGSLSLDDQFLVSEDAWRRGGAQSGGSTMFAELNSEIRIEDLITAVIVQSANDGCIILAEGIAGSEDAFVQLMNARAQTIGLEDSVFVNSTGLPADGQLVTMRDLVRLADHIQREYPEYYALYSLTAFEWNNINQRNRNPLLRMDISADGMKTGFTEESGYAILGSTNADGRRLIAAMSGMETQDQRAREARKLLEWGRRSFSKYRIVSDDGVVGRVDVYGGEQNSVPVRPQNSLEMLLPLIGDVDSFRPRIVYDFPLRPPIAEGDQIAQLRLMRDDEVAFEAPLVAAESVEAGPIHRRALDALSELAFGWIPDRIRP